MPVMKAYGQNFTVLRRKQLLNALAELVKTAKGMRQWGVHPMLCVPAPYLPPKDLKLLMWLGRAWGLQMQRHAGGKAEDVLHLQGQTGELGLSS